MALQMLFMALILWTANVLADCVTIEREMGVGVIVAYRLFSNKSLAIIDNHNRFVVYTWSGTIQYQEKLSLPIDPTRAGRPHFLSHAVIGNNSELYLASANKISFRYRNGAVEAQLNISAYYPLIYFSIGVKGLHETPMTFWEGATDMWSVDNGFLQVNSKIDVDMTYHNNKYVYRISTNYNLHEYYLVTRTNSVFTGKTVQSSGAWVLSPTNGDSLSAYVQQDSSLYMIVSNVGANTAFYVYSGFATRNADGSYPHSLVVRKRGSWSTTSLATITDYYVYSVAMHPNNSKAYFLTSNGDLYSMDFNSTTLVQSPPVRLIQAASPRLATLEVIDANTLAMRVDAGVWVQLLDISGGMPALGPGTPEKPSFGRSILGEDKLFVVYSSRKVSLIDTTTATASSFTASGYVREVAVNTDASKRRFYVLYNDKLEVYSLATYALVTSTSFASLQSSVTSHFANVSSVIALQDIDVLRVQTSKLAVLIQCKVGLGSQAVLMLLDENTLAYSASLMINYGGVYTVVAAIKATWNVDLMSVYLTDTMHVYKYESGSLALHLSYQNLHYEPQDSALASVMKFVSVPAGKMSPNDHMMGVTGNWVLADLDQYGYGKHIFNGGYSGDVFNNNKAWSVGNLMDVAKGTLSKKLGMLYTSCFWQVDAPNFSWTASCSDYIDGGIAFQRSDDKLVLYSGEDMVSSLKPKDCPSVSSLYYEWGFITCSVPNCLSCSYLDPSLCFSCSTGNYLAADMRSCSNSCADYVYDGKCNTFCPIETYYAPSTSPKKCLTSTECDTQNLLIFGDNCGKVISCPSGSTLSSGHVCTTSAAADSTSTITKAYPCGGSEVFWHHYKKCTTVGLLPTSNYTVNSKDAYCDGDTHYYMVSTGRCEKTCSLLDGVHAVYGRFCASPSECLSDLNISLDASSGTLKCVATCASTWIMYSNNTCVLLCASDQFTMSISGKAYCLTASECANMSGWGRSSTKTCVSACSAGEFQDFNSRLCVTTAECKALNKLVDPSGQTCTTTCPAATPYSYNQECASSCPASSFLEESDGSCVTACPEFNSANGLSCLREVIFTLNSESQLKVGIIETAGQMQFSSSRKLVKLVNTRLESLIVSICLVDKSDASIVDCSIKIKSIAWGVDRAIIMLSADKLTGISNHLVKLTLNNTIEFAADSYRVRFATVSTTTQVTTPQESINITQESSPISSPTVSFFRIIAIIMSSVKSLTPLLLSGFMSSSYSGNILCLIAQTYAKLVMVTNFNFELSKSQVSDMYYYVFKEFFDSINEQMITPIMGSSTVSLNKRLVCDAGYDKLCYLTVEDSFVMAHMITFVILIAQILALYLTARVLRILNKVKSSRAVMDRLKTVTLYAFILETGLEFWLTLQVGTATGGRAFGQPLLGSLKFVAYIVLLFYIVSFVALLSHNSSAAHASSQADVSAKTNTNLQNTLGVNCYEKLKFRYRNIVEEVFNRLKEIIAEVANHEKASGFLKFYLIHDFTMVALIVWAESLGSAQMFLWAGFEVVLIALMSKTQVFKSKKLFWRQVAIEFGFLILVTAQAIVPLRVDWGPGLSVFIFVTSLVILFVDLVFLIVEFTRTIINHVRARKAAKEVVDVNLEAAKGLEVGSTIGNETMKMNSNRITPIMKNTTRRAASPLRLKAFEINRSKVHDRIEHSESSRKLSMRSLNLNNESIMSSSKQPGTKSSLRDILSQKRISSGLSPAKL